MTDKKKKIKDNKSVTTKPVQEEPVLQPRSVNGKSKGMFELLKEKKRN